MQTSRLRAHIPIGSSHTRCHYPPALITPGSVPGSFFSRLSCPFVTLGRSLPDSSLHGVLQVRILEWVSSAKGSSRNRNQTWVSHITGRFFTIWVIRPSLRPQVATVSLPWSVLTPVNLRPQHRFPSQWERQNNAPSPYPKKSTSEIPSWLWSCTRKGGRPYQGPRVGSCLTFRSELSEETHGLTKQETLLGRGRPGGGRK